MREETVTRNIYSFDELNDSAKDTVRDHFRNTAAEWFGEDALDCDWYESAADTLGFQFATYSVPLMNGETRQKPCIYYSGFHSQGDGASFEGTYQYAKGCAKNIRTEFPNATALHEIADTLTAIQRKWFYGLSASIRKSGSYQHSGTMHVSVECDSGDREISEDVEETIQQAARDFADWIYSMLEADYEYQLSDESIDETIRCNEYEFDEDGHLA